MVDGINTQIAGASAAGVIQEPATPQRREGGAATDNAKASQEGADVKAVQSDVLNSLLGPGGAKNSDDFIGQAEAILNEALSLKSADTKLSIDIDDDSGLFVYKSIDKQSGEVISQFPAEEVLALIAYYREAEGIVVDEKV